MHKKILYHGSNMIIKKPQFGQGNPYNDYGLGFYCTENIELAKEWACLDKDGGFTNAYAIDTEKLTILNLSDKKYNILNWLAILVDNRTFRIENQIANQAREYLLSNFLLDISNYDALIGYRADDSYFAFAMDFLNNSISLRQLENAMYLGNLGEQFVLKSEKSFGLIEFMGNEIADGETYYIKRMARDNEARDAYLNGERNSALANDDLFMIDILRRGIQSDDARIRRKIFE